MKTLIILSLFVGFYAQAESGKNGKVIYKYKKYEKFDLDKLDITSESESPGDLSVNNRFHREFKNKLPYKRNFKKETLNNIIKY